ncbi:MAG: ribosome maturation factor RimM [Candidatus Electryoneaceae bacterium]|nr:ribosome maturation factor RimM [Candidatus Electryoneaceae bacterium]
MNLRTTPIKKMPIHQRTNKTNQQRQINQRPVNPPGISVKAPEDPTVIGRIARPVGVHGEVKVFMEPTHPDRLLSFNKLIVRSKNQCRLLTVENIEKTAGWFRVKLSGLNTPEEAAFLGGWEIITSTAERPILDDDEFYIDDLIGCIVYTDDDEELGLLREVMSQAHHDLWVIDGFEGEILLPAVKDFIVGVDVKQHRIVIKRIEGLWD